MIYKTKLADFELFKKEALRWQEILGLKEWRLYFEWRDLKENTAQIGYDLVYMQATLFLNKKIKYVRSVKMEHEIRKSAFHELIHLVIAPLEYIAENRRYEADEWNSLGHALIRRLENTLFEKYEET